MVWGWGVRVEVAVRRERVGEVGKRKWVPHVDRSRHD